MDGGRARTMRTGHLRIETVSFKSRDGESLQSICKCYRLYFARMLATLVGRPGLSNNVLMSQQNRNQAIPIPASLTLEWVYSFSAFGVLVDRYDSFS